MKEKKIVFIVPILVFLVALLVKFGLPEVKNLMRVKRGQIKEGVSKIQLPDNWEISSESENEVILTRQEDREIETKVVLLKSEKEIDDFSAYIDRLIQGAEKSLPTLHYQMETGVKEQDGWLKKQLAGYYYSSGDKISLMQTVYYQDPKLVTVTASFSENETKETEIEFKEVFDFLEDTYLKTSS